jgi:hypothetical protein
LLHAGSKRNFSESLAPVNAVNNYMGVKNHVGDFSHVRGATSDSKEKNTIAKKNRLDGSDFEGSFISNSDGCRPLAQVLPHHLKQNGNYKSYLIEANNDSSLATSRSRRSKYTYMPSDSGETHSHSDVPSLQMASAGADFETDCNLQNSGTFSEEHTSSDFGKQGTESTGREISESETEDDTELLQSTFICFSVLLNVL